ncbi:hypothetical protein K438DRAFT_1860027 [Mycena galopus ATCC 62051]|nr:hypothetical protein K438DRAFT_1860027 [Mycena galopus ATCC 62051]
MDPVTPSESISLLPGEVAKQVELWRYVGVGTAAIFIWDILSNLKGDYELLFNNRVHWPVATYFLSRITTAVYVIGFAIFLTYPVGACRALDLGLQSLYPVAIPSTSLLFFFRVRAVYDGARTITIIFGLMWITELATCIIVPFATGGVNIEPTRYCIVSEVPSYSGAVGMVPAVFDTAVFIAISYKLVGNAYIETERVRAFFTGAYLPSLSKSLLVDGQVYYFITVLGNIAAGVMVGIPNMGIPYRLLPVLPTVMLTNVMACHVYRYTRLNLSQQSVVFPSGNIGGESAAQLHSSDFVGQPGLSGSKDCETGERENPVLEGNGR